MNASWDTQNALNRPVLKAPQMDNRELLTAKTSHAVWRVKKDSVTAPVAIYSVLVQKKRPPFMYQSQWEKRPSKCQLLQRPVNGTEEIFTHQLLQVPQIVNPELIIAKSPKMAQKTQDLLTVPMLDCCSAWRKSTLGVAEIQVKVTRWFANDYYWNSSLELPCRNPPYF